MKKILIPIMLVFSLCYSVTAMDFAAPQVPESAQRYMPNNTESFGEGVWYVIKTAVMALHPSFAEASGICLSLIVASILISVLQSFSGNGKRAVELAGVLIVSIILLQPAKALLQLGITAVKNISEYGKLLLPVMTAAVAAQGGTVTSASLYAGTAFFNTVLTTMITNLIVPLLYIYLCLCVANSAVGESLLKTLRDFAKWVMTWCLKIILYLFTGYIGITGVISGAADATAIKAARLAISGVVPVVGGILSDASETILVSAGVMKNAVGVYGLLAVIAVCIGPFLQIGMQYLLLKMCAAICAVLGTKKFSELIQDFSSAMGFVLAMTGTVCLLLLISIVCFMKGVS